MSKTLYLMRHAEATFALGSKDKNRPLSAHGISQACAIGEHIQDIDHVICSSAIRTRMTLQYIQEGVSNIKSIEYSDALYNAPAGNILRVIQKSTYDKILIIAHNPGIHLLANMLVKDDCNDNTTLEKLRLFYNPATLSIIECGIDSWSDIQPNENKLLSLIIPD